MNNFKHTEETKNKMRLSELGKSRGRHKYTIMTPDNNIDTVHNLRAYCRGLGLHQPSMVKVVNGEYKQYLNYRLIRKSEVL